MDQEEATEIEIRADRGGRVPTEPRVSSAVDRQRGWARSSHCQPVGHPGQARVFMTRSHGSPGVSGNQEALRHPQGEAGAAGARTTTDPGA